MYWCESSTIKKAEHQRIDAFGLMLEKSPESPLDNREIQPVNPKVNHPWLFIGRTDAEAEVPILWPPDSKSQLTGKDPDAGKDWRQEKGPIEDKMVRWHHWLSGCEFKQAPGDSEGQGSLVSCSPWGWKESDVTEQLSNKGFQTPPVPMILTCWDPKTILVNRLDSSAGGHLVFPLEEDMLTQPSPHRQVSDDALVSSSRTFFWEQSSQSVPADCTPGPSWGETTPGPHHTILTVLLGTGPQQDHSLPSLAPRNQEQVFVFLGQHWTFSCSVWKRAGTRFAAACG